jgi:hypothetical protein
MSSLLGDGQHPREDLHRRLAGDEAQTFAQFDGPSGDAVEQSRAAGVGGRPAPRIERGARTGRSGQALPQSAHLGPLAAGEDHPQRVEQYHFGMALDRCRDVFPPRRRDETCQSVDLLPHPPRYGSLSRLREVSAHPHRSSASECTRSPIEE